MCFSAGGAHQRELAFLHGWQDGQRYFRPETMATMTP
jgi:hypothetical protein